MDFNYKTNLVQYFLETCNKYPEKIAVIDGVYQISFDELKNYSYSLAVNITNIHNGYNQPIGVYLPKSYQTVVSDLGITMSGNAYMNLDINTPIDRINNIVQLIQPVIIITNGVYFEKIQTICNSNCKIINIDKLERVEFNIDFLQRTISNLIDTDPYCIINTSGSTGTPKGVVLNHRSYINYTVWAINKFSIEENFILGVLSPVVFDHFNYEFTLMLIEGVQLVLLDNAMATFPIKLLESIVLNKVNYIFWVPTIMVNIANMDLLAKLDLSNLQLICFAGEVFPTKQFNYWRKYLNHAKFVNLYGPTEATVDCTYYIINRDLRDDEPIPIGRQCENTNVFILNENNEVEKLGDEGELCIRGISLAMGYYNNWEKTNLAFVQNPLNKSYPELIYRTGDIVSLNEFSEIVFRGRKDSLIKHLGYRIELGEIEHIVVNDLKLFDNACAIYDTKMKEIILFFESEFDGDIIQFRKLLSKRIPKYMIPSKFIKIEQMPRNANGKIDRVLLKSNYGN